MPTLSLREYKKLTFLSHLFAQRTGQNTRELSNTSANLLEVVSGSGITRQNSASSLRSVTKRTFQQNPLYGFSIESIRAVKSNTIVFRVKSDIYKRFL